MAKKRESGSSSEKPDEARARITKLFLHDAELRQLRVAAALVDEGVSEFIRAAALERAAEVVSHGFPPKG